MTYLTGFVIRLNFRYAAEVHIVHWNLKYGNFANATKHNDGLAVLGVLIGV